MVNKKRKKREEINPDNIDMFKPIDVFSLGSDNDPCFGKLHDLMASECKECGDSEFCVIVKSQNLNKERLDIEVKQRFKDIEESDQEELIKRDKILSILKIKKSMPHKRLKLIISLHSTHGISKKIIKKLYDQA